jgi:hypothetical protein
MTIENLSNNAGRTSISASDTSGRLRAALWIETRQGIASETAVALKQVPEKETNSMTITESARCSAHVRLAGRRNAAVMNS